MVIRRGEIWWADVSGCRHPVLVVQSDAFNRSRIATVVVAAVTANLDLAAAPGNVLLSATDSGLPRDSVVNVSQLLTLDHRFLTARAGVLPAATLAEVETGTQLVLGLA